ncbi:HAD-IC family P-type ATPase [Sphingobium estronivorans]|uniref:HAD-IC family P-type ATPase n=1 Tax=Sphingobium estronivorans TaxID=1577690 RepID=UPI0019687125|nr:HAD-IC family P-type ATPase [Sphingobium estronivorans]
MVSTAGDTIAMGEGRHIPAGLSQAEARARLSQYGFNEILEERPSLVRGIAKRLWGPIPWMLEAALVLEVLLRRTVEPTIIAAWLLFSAVLGAIQERRARAALDLLRSRLQVSARACRDENWLILPARDLVPGDVIRLQSGDLVPADCNIHEGSLEVDQSALTGESTTITRTSGETIYSGSTTRRGAAVAVVTQTGPRSYFGHTAELLRTSGSAGHLDRLLFAVVRYLVVVDAVLAAVLIAVLLWRGADVLPLVPFFLVLVTATVPVTMPAAFTVANAVEARRLANAGVLVTGLSAIQEAATMDVLCIDKTGTLTQNRQSVASVVSLTGEPENDILAWAATACDETSQSPLDLAILRALDRSTAPDLARMVHTPFDPAAKRSEAYVRKDGNLLHIVLGSPLAVAPLAEPQPELSARVDALGQSGARVLAVAVGPADALTLRGLIALADTPREDAGALVDALRTLGVRLLMVSGDTIATARAVSRAVGLGDRFGDAPASLADPLHYDGFAGFFPEDKLRLVQTLQKAGSVTGMTGDGINDAPALKQAEVGIAVSTASDVAKAAAQVVLTHEGLVGIVEVVSAGRRVYRRMLTWTITKIARTVELAALLTIGYIATGVLVTPLALIAVIIVLNDIVTITLATDRAWISPVPERWEIREIAKVAGVIAIGWLGLAFAILWAVRVPLELPDEQIQTLMFAYLMYSAQATIYLTRVRDRFWSFAPSRFVAAATAGNIIVPSALGYWGLLTAPVPAAYLGLVLAAVLIAAVILDQLKIWIFRQSGILGRIEPINLPSASPWQPAAGERDGG